MTEGWLLDRAMALAAALLDERDRKARCLVTLPPEGATLLEIERAALVAALDRTGWVQTKAAAELGITARVMLYKMGRYNLYRDNPHGVKRRTRPPGAPWGPGRSVHPRRPGKDWRLRAADMY